MKIIEGIDYEKIKARIRDTILSTVQRKQLGIENVLTYGVIVAIEKTLKENIIGHLDEMTPQS